VNGGNGLVMAKLELEVCAAWWLPVYIRCLALFCAVSGLEADTDKLERIVRRAISVRAKR
jgi:hypothetical protein